jgi:hypothetical protein
VHQTLLIRITEEKSWITNEWTKSSCSQDECLRVLLVADILTMIEVIQINQNTLCLAIQYFIYNYLCSLAQLSLSVFCRCFPEIHSFYVMVESAAFIGDLGIEARFYYF